MKEGRDGKGGIVMSWSRSALAAERSVLYVDALLAGANSYELALTAFSAVTPAVGYGCAVPSARVMCLYSR